ncbi:MAG: PAS domain S-box protein [Coriobacteriia bacterium]|nr:PAS domain S-box protein [Coriobacteriia bacterium]
MTTIVDITERRRAEEELRRTTATLQAAMDQSPAGIAIADAPDGALRYVNEAGLLIGGGDAATLTDSVGIAEYVASWQLLDTDGRPLEADEVPLARAIMFGETNSREFVIKRAEGDERTVLSNAAPIRDDDGAVVSAVVVFTDITEQKRSADELQRSQMLLNSSLEAQKDTIHFSIDADYRYLFFNQAQVDAMRFAYGIEIEIGMCVLDCITSDDDRIAAKENYDRALAGESHSNVRVYGDVQLAYYESYFNPIVDESGAVVGATGLARDISERKAAEDALRDSEERLSRAVAQAPIPMMIHAEDGTVVQINREWERITGYALADIPTTAEWTRLAYGAGAASVREDIERLYGLGEPKDEGEYVIRTKDGRERVWYFRSSLLGAVADGRRTVISTALDITERKHAEDEVLRLNAELEQRVQERTEELNASNEELSASNEELSAINEELAGANAQLNEMNVKVEEANRAKTDFLAAMSHELRTPLNSIIGFSGVLLQGLSGSLGDEQRRQVAMINNSGRHLLALINEVLDLAKVESSQHRPVFSNADVGALVLEMFETIRPMAEAKGLEMRREIPAGSIPILTDALRVDQIVLNLLGNAVKFTEAGYVSARVEQDDHGVTVTVEDSGCGIGAEDLDRVFEDFYQVLPHSSAKSEGTGLGLGRVPAPRRVHRGDHRSRQRAGSWFGVHAPRPGSIPR